MRHSVSTVLLGAFAAFKSALAQSAFPPEPLGLIEIVSERWPGASISYKQVSCSTLILTSCLLVDHDLRQEPEHFITPFFLDFNLRDDRRG